MVRFFYNLLIHTIGAPIILAYYAPKIIFNGKYSRSLRGKLGRLPDTFPEDSLIRPVVWFHAVSVGEVVALAPVVREFRKLAPDYTIIVSTGTETGQEKATTSINDVNAFIYLPIDFPVFVNPVIDRIMPDLFVLMETEIWPNLLHGLKAKGAIIALANGRISDRSFPRYMKIRPFLARMLGKIDAFLMVSATDKERILDMGAPSERVQVVGNTKFDAALRNFSEETLREAQGILDVDENDMVLMAGSTHPGEHEQILDCFIKLRKGFPDLILVIAPRHVETVPSILTAINDRKLEAPFVRSSFESGARRGSSNIVLLDTTGELFKFYSVATVVVMGGSFVPRGGQNILEPIVWGKRVFFGPSMEDFRDARDLMTAVGAASEARDLDELCISVSQALKDVKHSMKLGSLGREELARHSGSAKTTAHLLFDLVSPAEKA
ncbi:MAG: 3-deoxy-D-manno-octulosonic acid transferase [Deltaproteobacteria bacterium]|nr:3-deoxy-D-manno-octulosonic acid transferase [Deltaproteobacteria bacterium]